MYTRRFSVGIRAKLVEIFFALASFQQFLVIRAYYSREAASNIGLNGLILTWSWNLMVCQSLLKFSLSDLVVCLDLIRVLLRVCNHIEAVLSHTRLSPVTIFCR